jgi:hypothetical protein
VNVAGAVSYKRIVEKAAFVLCLSALGIGYPAVSPSVCASKVDASASVRALSANVTAHQAKSNPAVSPVPEIIVVKTSPLRPSRLQTVRCEIKAPDPSAALVKAILLTPSAGAAPLALAPVTGRPGSFTAEIKLADEATEGLYAVHFWTGDARNPRAVGKSFFLLGKLIADYPILSLIDKSDPASDIQSYLADFQRLGGNLLILHVLIDGQQAYYPSKIAKNSVAGGSQNDLVEGFLTRADRMGFPCLLSVSWDLTHNTDYATCMDEIKAIAAELYSLYGHHPSMAGIYSYQEGSGTYLLPYLREFCGFVKELNPGLLTSCAPYVDDPLLAGYMGTLESLDMIIYQGMVMASYRPDNAKRYPLRRVRDFCSVGIGSKQFQGKIAITHVELFGYLENRVSPHYSTTTYENIYRQILSAAAAVGSDGISFFTYHANIHAPIMKYKEIARSKQAVEDGLAAFKVIWDNASNSPNTVQFYLPYSDWAVERYQESFLPAFDGFRVLGIPASFLPYTPPMKESVYPFYPYHKNEEVLVRLVRDGNVLVLPDISGFHSTDSDFIKAFVGQGGTVVAFGPKIPMGNTYDRDKLFGGTPFGVKLRRKLTVREALGRRTRVGQSFGLDGRAYPAWTAAAGTMAKVVATFDDGSAAVLINRFGKGYVLTVTMDALSAAKLCPDLIRDVMTEAFRASGHLPLVDVTGLNENTDMAVKRTAHGLTIALINYNDSPLTLTLKPAAGGPGIWTDLASRKAVQVGFEEGALRQSIPGGQFLCLEFRK